MYLINKLVYCGRMKNEELQIELDQTRSI